MMLSTVSEIEFPNSNQLCPFISRWQLFQITDNLMEEGFRGGAFSQWNESLFSRELRGISFPDVDMVT